MKKTLSLVDTVANEEESASRSAIRVLHVTAYRSGGAGRAAQRIARATSMIHDVPVESTFFYSQPEQGVSGFFRMLAKQVVRIISRGLFRPGTSDLHSVAVIRTGLARWINKQPFDIVHLHWLGDSAISIEEISQISAPVVWTMHDMWPFCGAEHYTDNRRYSSGYQPENRPPSERGPDINRWVWHRKMRHWTMPVHAIAPSQWLADAAKASVLGRQWDVRTIPYPVDVGFWSPGDRDDERSRLEIDDNDVFLVFVAEKGLDDERKGGPDIIPIANELSKLVGKRRVVVGVAGGYSSQSSASAVAVRQFGLLKNDAEIRSLYRAADFSLVPSRRDNFPLTIAESLSCGALVASYNSTGAAEMIEHGSHGVLAETADFAGIAHAIAEVLLGPPERVEHMKQSARSYALEHWTPEKIGAEYSELYRELLRTNKESRGVEK